MEITIVNDDRRSALRGEIKSFIKILIEDKNYLIGEVISEFLIASAASITSDEVPVSTEYYMSEDIIDDDDEEKDDDFYFETSELDGTPEEQKERQDRYESEMAAEHEFHNLGVTKSIAKLQATLERYTLLKKHKEIFETEKSILKLSCEYAKEWSRLLSKFEYNSYYMPINLSDMCKTSASLLDSETIDYINATALELSEILGEKYFSYEVFNVDREQCIKDLSDMKSVYEYVRQNPGCKQAKIYSELSVDGRRIGNLIEWAVKHGRMNRIRDKSTWLLYLTAGA